MIVRTASGIEMNSAVVSNYFNSLVGSFFKILPLYESRESSLRIYMECLRDELEGCSHVLENINYDSMFLSLIASLQYMIDNLDNEACDAHIYKRKVFSAISMCNKLSQRYSGNS